MSKLKVINIPDSLSDLIDCWLPFVDLKGIAIGGGFIRDYYAGRDPKDMDIYFPYKERYYDACSYFTTDLNSCKINQTDYSSTYMVEGNIIQLVKIVFHNDDMDSLLETFDFTVCKAAVYEGKLHMDPEFHRDLMKRQLVYTGSGTGMPILSLHRAIKFCQDYGYHIDINETNKILKEIRALSDNDFADMGRTY